MSIEICPKCGSNCSDTYNCIICGLNRCLWTEWEEMKDKIKKLESEIEERKLAAYRWMQDRWF